MGELDAGGRIKGALERRHEGSCVGADVDAIDVLGAVELLMHERHRAYAGTAAASALRGLPSSLP
jgi:hypothetical protein